MRDKKLIGGIICMVAAAIMFATGAASDEYVPGAIAILAVGIALVATSKKKRH